MMVLSDRNARSEFRPILDGVQYLRGLCAVIVVVGHCNGILGLPDHYSRMAISDWSFAAGFAVAAFFSISGFIIAVASLDNAGTPKMSRTEYMRRRFVRIVPYLWFCTIAYNVLSWANTGLIEWGDIARTLVVWPLGELKPNVVWSLRQELLFYVFFALTVMGSRPRPRLVLLWLALSAVFYFVAYDLGLAAGLAGQNGFELLKVLAGGDHGANFQFGFGLAIGYRYLLRPTTLPLGRVPAVAMLAFLIGAGVIVTLWPFGWGLPTSLLWTALAMPVLISAVCAIPLRGWIGKAGLVLGNASFSIYLIHNPVILIVLAIAKKLTSATPNELQLLAMLFIGIAIAVSCGIAAHYLVEVPLIRLSERWTRGASRRPARILVDGG